MKSVYGSSVDEKVLQAMMKAADTDGDGEVDLEEVMLVYPLPPIPQCPPAPCPPGHCPPGHCPPWPLRPAPLVRVLRERKIAPPSPRTLGPSPLPSMVCSNGSPRGKSA